MKINMKKIILYQSALAFFLLLTLSLQAQPTFIKTIGGVFDESGYSMLQGANGDYYLIKTDVNGTPLWSKSYGNILKDMSISVIATADNGYLMCGVSKTQGTGIFCSLLIKTNKKYALLSRLCIIKLTSAISPHITIKNEYS